MALIRAEELGIAGWYVAIFGEVIILFRPAVYALAHNGAGEPIDARQSVLQCGIGDRCLHC
jgi:hypothetical protein